MSQFPTENLCAICRPAGTVAHGGAAWLLVQAGKASATLSDFVAQAQAQCRDHGTVLEIDMIGAASLRRQNLANYHGLLGVVDEGSSTDDLRRMTELVVSYRARHPQGWQDLAEGEPWYKVGIVQLAGPRHVLDSHEMRVAAGKIDSLHGLDAQHDLNLFELFSRDVHLDIPDASERRVVRQVRAWGIEPDEVAAVLAAIDDARQIFEDPAFAALYRPIPSIARNQFDLILDFSTESRFSREMPDRKTWMDNGARACRLAVREVQRDFPNFRRPAERDGKKGLQRELRALYENLRLMREIQRGRRRATIILPEHFPRSVV